MEEGLLIGSVLGSDYGTIEVEPEVPVEAVVVSKGKKKKRVVGQQTASPVAGK
jgi:hypothetical protein